MISEVYNCDCMDYMRDLPDNYFSLAIADPPYDIGRNRRNSYQGGGKLKGRIMAVEESKFRQWDNQPEQEFFDELFRVSQNQIIWGGNYFSLPPTRCIVCWDKVQPFKNFSQVEMAWTSFDNPAKVYKQRCTIRGRIHPTQKPVELYTWLLETFATGGG